MILIYFDHAATTPIRHEILDTYNDLLNNFFANPSSLHRLGQETSHLLFIAREQIASLFKRKAEEVIFTSGATEANNLAIKGYALRYQNRGKHLITSKVEHPSVLKAFEQLEKQGFECTYLDVEENGTINLEQLKKSIRNDTILVSIMAVNNEVGSINNIKEIASIVHQYPKAVFHSDTTQAIGKIDIPYNDIDMFVLSAHKLNGLKGSGALIKRKHIELMPLLSGGGQEFDYRSGTNDFQKEVVLAKTIRLILEEQKSHYLKVKELHDYLIDLLNTNKEISLNSPIDGSPYIINFSFLSKKASVIVEALSKAGIMVSTISACSSKKTAHSYVLEAMGKSKQIYQNSLRVSFGYQNTKEEIDCFIKALFNTINSIR